MPRRVYRSWPTSWSRSRVDVGLTWKPAPGACGEKMYTGVTAAKLDAILARLLAEGAVIAGNNPFVVDTKHHGVKLAGTWYRAKETLRIEVTHSNRYASCPDVWEGLDERILSFGVQIADAESPPIAPDEETPPVTVPDVTPTPNSSQGDERVYVAVGVAAFSVGVLLWICSSLGRDT